MKIIILLLISLFTCTLALANDTTGTIAAGGIQFTQEPSIKMASEDLTISRNKVKVSYSFKNLSDKPISTTVFFPLPPFQGEGQLMDSDSVTDYTKEAKGNDPLVNFSVVVDGKPVAYHIKIQAVANDGKDITSLLSQAHIPLLPEMVERGYTGYFVEDLNKEDLKRWQAKAKQLGLLDKEGKAHWKKQVIFYWPQLFPANKTIAITHEYTPATGNFYNGTGFGSKEDCFKAIEEELKETFHIDFSNLENRTTFENWLASHIINTDDDKQPFFYIYNVGYILTTGANWAGPIEKFTLNLQYPAGGSVAFAPFYPDASAKITRTSGQLQVILNNFTPKQDLNIVFGEVTG